MIFCDLQRFEKICIPADAGTVLEIIVFLIVVLVVFLAAAVRAVRTVRAVIGLILRLICTVLIVLIVVLVVIVFRHFAFLLLSFGYGVSMAPSKRNIRKNTGKYWKNKK